MKKKSFKSARFITSALEEAQWPQSHTAAGARIQELAIVGRSNVGKSSLINHLLGKKEVAKVSSKPGKTQRLNYFLIDETFYLVDLPGYGYARVNKSMKKDWSVHLEDFFNKRTIDVLLFLIDCRRGLQEEDEQFLNQLSGKVNIIPVVTKTDKLNQSEKHKVMQALSESLREYSPIPYSVKEGRCKEHLIHRISTLLQESQ